MEIFCDFKRKSINEWKNINQKRTKNPTLTFPYQKLRRAAIYFKINEKIMPWTLNDLRESADAETINISVVKYNIKRGDL